MMQVKSKICHMHFMATLSDIPDHACVESLLAKSIKTHI